MTTQTFCFNAQLICFTGNLPEHDDHPHPQAIKATAAGPPIIWSKHTQCATCYSELTEEPMSTTSLEMSCGTHGRGVMAHITQESWQLDSSKQRQPVRFPWDSAGRSEQCPRRRADVRSPERNRRAPSCVPEEASAQVQGQRWPPLGLWSHALPAARSLPQRIWSTAGLPLVVISDFVSPVFFLHAAQRAGRCPRQELGLPARTSGHHLPA